MIAAGIALTTMALLQFQPGQPPVAKKSAHKTVIHGETLVADYYWLRNKTSRDVISYLEAENAHTDTVMKKTEKLQSQLYDEMLGRIKQTDLSVPYPYRGYLYYTRTEEGKQYQIYCRKSKGSNKEEILLD